MKTNLIAAAALLALTTGFASAQTSTTAPATKPGTTADRPAGNMAAPMPPASPMAPRMSSADRAAAMTKTKDQIEQMLKGAKSRGDYAKMLGKDGYRISSINADKKDFLEYEVVKGDESYEVRLDFKDGATKATDIKVTNNMWRAPSTKAMLEDKNYKMTTPMVADAEGRYSDSRYMKASTDEKDQLEKLKTANMTADQYMAKLKERGYQVTATNDKEADAMEYEILKGENSYEVQLKIDAATKVIKDVDVSTNVWDAPGTERAKDAKAAKEGKKVASRPAASMIAPGAAIVPPRGANMRSADRTAALTKTKDQIEQMLQGAQARGDYAAMLEKNGYRISSINADKKDFLEYEVVKGDDSYEVRLDFKDGAAKATDIKVTNNMWRAPSTKAMLKDKNYKATTPMVADAEGRYSDSRYMKASDDEKEQLEKLKTANMTAAQYMAKLKDRGYKITATNDKEADAMEYEILKGENSYEVQLKVDAATKVIKDVDVSTNVWDAPGTERAKDAKEAMKK